MLSRTCIAARAAVVAGRRPPPSLSLSLTRQAPRAGLRAGASEELRQQLRQLPHLTQQLVDVELELQSRGGWVPLMPLFPCYAGSGGNEAGGSSNAGGSSGGGGGEVHSQQQPNSARSSSGGSDEGGSGTGNGFKTGGVGMGEAAQSGGVRGGGRGGTPAGGARRDGSWSIGWGPEDRALAEYWQLRKAVVPAVRKRRQPPAQAAAVGARQG
jgi:hypothetical protein